MPLALHAVDVGVLGLYLALVLLVGVYFRGQSKDSRDFFLADRSMKWRPIGLSVLATLITAQVYCEAPSSAYDIGFKMLLAPIALWLGAPLMVNVVLPLYYRLNIVSIYEYFELRFDVTTRTVASSVLVLWRFVWLSIVLYVPCKVLMLAVQTDIPPWAIVATLGCVTTIYTVMGGMRAVLWTDVIQATLILGGILLVIGGVWWSLEEGPVRVWQIASALGRTQVADLNWSWTDDWTFWAALPQWGVTLLTLYIADQVVVQRFLTAHTLDDSRRSFLSSCAALSLLVFGLAYAGLCLLAYYHDHPRAMRASWVVNLDGHSREGMTYGQRDQLAEKTYGVSDHDPRVGEPMLAWNELQTPIATARLRQLIDQKRILRPNSKQPIESVDELALGNAIGGEIVQWDVSRLAMREPPPDSGVLREGEIVMHVRAGQELLPQFVAVQLPWGVAGAFLAGLLAAAMSSFDSGVHSLSTLLVVDFHRRLGWGRAILARRRHKRAEQLDEEDEVGLARSLTLLLGAAATLGALCLVWADKTQGNVNVASTLAMMNAFGGPVLAVFLLGIFSSRCNARGALAALVFGTLLSVWLISSNRFSEWHWLWPFRQRLGVAWTVTFSVAGALLIGWFSSLILGRRQRIEDIRGLVVGRGRLGDRRSLDKRP